MEMAFQPCSWQEEGEARSPQENGVSHEKGWQRVIRIPPQITGTMYPLCGLLLVAPDLSWGLWPHQPLLQLPPAPSYKTNQIAPPPEAFPPFSANAITFPKCTCFLYSWHKQKTHHTCLLNTLIFSLCWACYAMIPTNRNYLFIRSSSISHSVMSNSLRLHDCSPPGSSDHWVLQAIILEWVAIPFWVPNPGSATSNLCVLKTVITKDYHRDWIRKLR